VYMSYGLHLGGVLLDGQTCGDVWTMGVYSCTYDKRHILIEVQRSSY